MPCPGSPVIRAKPPCEIIAWTRWAKVSASGATHLSLVLWLFDPRGDNNSAVVEGHVQISCIDVRFIVTGFGDARQ